MCPVFPLQAIPLLQQTIETDHPPSAIKKQTVTGLGAGISGMYGTGYVGGFGMGSSHEMAMSMKNYNHLQAERLSSEEFWRHNLGHRSQVSVGMVEDAFQGIALSEEFLQEYYSQVRDHKSGFYLTVGGCLCLCLAVGQYKSRGRQSYHTHPSARLLTAKAGCRINGQPRTLITSISLICVCMHLTDTDQYDD